MLDALRKDWEPSKPWTEPLKAPETPAPLAQTNSLLTSSLKGKKKKKKVRSVSKCLGKLQELVRAKALNIYLVLS